MIVLEIAIGLVFIYFLYSLLLTIIVEIISAWLGLRARILRQGIGNLLNDHRIEGIGLDFVKWIKDIFVVEPASFKYTIAGKFYQQPSIKYRAKVGENAWYSIRNTKPGYLSKKNFADTIISMLAKKGKGNSVWEKVQFAIEKNALHLEPDTLTRFQDMLQESNGKYELFVNELRETFDQMMDRVNGWYKRKIRLILFWLGMVITMGFNVDTLQIIRILSENKVARQQMVDLAIAATDSTSQLNLAMQKSNDTSKTYEMWQESYGVVAHATRDAKLIMGRGWDIPLSSTSGQDSLELDIITFSIIRDSIDMALRDGKKRMTRLKSQLAAKPTNLRQTLDSIKILQDSLDGFLSQLNQMIDMKYYGIDTIIFHDVSNPVVVVKGLKYSKADQSSYLFSEITKPKKLLGLLLTALALTLGAPFWFDLLKKLIAIRNSGVNPDEKKGENKNAEQLATSKSNGLHPISLNPVDVALSEYRKYWESQPGVIGVNRGLVEVKKSKKECISIVVVEGFNTNQFPEFIKVPIEGVDHEVKIDVKTGELGNLTEGSASDLPGYIKNPEEKKGTPTGFVINKKTGKLSLLTCCHVVQIKDSPFIDPDKSQIKMSFSRNQKIEYLSMGKVQNMVISSFIDAACIDFLAGFTQQKINELNPTNSIREIKMFRDLNRNEEYRTTILIHTLRGPIPAKLTNSDMNYTFNKDGSTEHRFFDLFEFGDEGSNYTKLLTIKGDSGALITDDQDKPIGMLIAHAKIGNQFYSYGLKLKDVFEILQIEVVS